MAKAVLSRTFTSQISACSHRYWRACKATKISGFYPRPECVEVLLDRTSLRQDFPWYFGFSLSVLFCQCSMPVFILLPLLSEGQVGKAWDPSMKAMLPVTSGSKWQKVFP